MGTERHGLQLMPGREVWAHSTHQGQVDFQGDGVPIYDSEAPLLLRPGGYSSTPIGARMAEVKDAGVDGLQLLTYEGEAGDSWGSYMRAEAEAAGVKLAPCYATDNANTLAAQTAQWIATMGSSSCVGRIEGKYMVWLYNPSSALDVTAFLNDSRVAGQVELLADVGVGAATTNLQINTTRLDGHGTRYRAAWAFEDSMDRGNPAVFEQYTNWARTRYMPWIGGLQPSYNREVPATGGFIDAEGTKLYRRMWQRHLSHEWIRWVTIVTWQDFSEGHTIRPTTQWSLTRADVTKWFSDQMKGTDHPSTAQLYVTAPVQVTVGDQVLAEALVLNGSSSDATVTVQLVNQDGTVVHTKTGTVAAGQAADVTTADSGITAGWVLPKVTMVVAGASTSLVGAPVLVHPAGFVPTTPYRRRYFSLAARGAASYGANLTVSGGKATLTCSGTARFMEVLQNGRVAGRSFNSNTVTATVPMASYDGVGSQTYQAASTGWLVGRVVGTDGSICYTNPVRLG